MKSHKLETIEDVTEEEITAARCIHLDDCEIDAVIFSGAKKRLGRCFCFSIFCFRTRKQKMKNRENRQ